MQKLSFAVEKELKHHGICDASGAIALDDNSFIVANDEDNFLRVYSADESGKPRTIIDINNYFPNNPEKEEVDIEAATELNGLIYWITSHGRNKKKKRKPLRHQFFANKITHPGQPILEQVGKSYTQLVFKDMFQDERLKNYVLEKAEELAPKEKGGLNIEGLTATPDGKLLIGFRNPIPRGKALILPLTNPLDLIQEKEDEVNAIFGNPIELDLGGLGIRSIEYWQVYQVYLIIAGAYDSSDEFALYWWSGNCQDTPEKIEAINLPSDFRPEAVLFYPNRKNQLQIISDDGAIIRADGKECKEIKDENHSEKYFRSLWITVSET
ncbi:DUF3616 domain-containing protein [Allocoleopsis franciscana]|uniref:DUF3616 domain-containing protein n=1 Tax=Allocoleopsis franciscana PCC 7113 TaxID=1173027 RepID=K9WFS7_9CYAN|nr:DUF3616 domain-containing protein [Allocoleopsis franciscana]AFZ19270.1 Protein of unknown function (DUF3616) [Allocoleopsis franciscana PCC 7113]